MTERMGFWVDMEDPYVTLHDDYIESAWWSLKQMFQKGLLFRGHKVLPYCPQTGTVTQLTRSHRDTRKSRNPQCSLSSTRR